MPSVPGSEGNFWYSFNVGNMHVTSMSTEHPYEPGSAQYAFLESDLAGVDRSVTPWLVLVSHRPFLASDEFALPSHQIGSELISTIGPLMMQYAVDLVVSGHCHVYERTYPVNPLTGVPVQSNSSVFVNPGVPVIATIGTGGAIYPDSWVQPQPDWSAVRLHINETTGEIIYGYAVVETSATSLSWTMLLLDGGIGDRFVIERSMS